MLSTEIGRSAIRRRIEVACATVIRWRFSPASSAFATSNGQIAGATASPPLASRSSSPSVKVVLSSAKHQPKATDASNTIRLVAAAIIDQLPHRDPFQARALANLPDLAHRLLQI